MARKITITRRFLFVLIGLGMIFWGFVGLFTYYTPKMATKDWDPEIPFQKGVSFTTWGSHSYNSTEARQEFQKMRANGVEWVAINAWWFQSNLTSHDIHAGAWSDTSKNITDSFLYARSIGLRVLYKPMLNLLEHQWRSFINYTPQWMDAYTNFMIERAREAQLGGAEALSIGTEMGNMQVHSEDVRQMIGEIKQEYDGLLTYSANHDSVWYVDWWDAVDFIGISQYSPMTVEFDPTQQELENVWDGYYHKLESFSRKWNRSICFTETGAQALDGSNIVPNDNRLSDQKDVQELVDIYVSLFQSKLWSAPWFKGAYWWIWDFYEPDPEQPGKDIGFSPEIPAVLNAINEEYTSERQIRKPDVLVRNLIPFSLSIGLFILLSAYSKKWNLLSKPPESLTLSVDNEENIPKDRDKNADSGFVLLKKLVGENWKSTSAGAILGSILFLIFTSITIDLFTVISSSFSYSVILGISPTQTLLFFCGIILLAFIVGIFALKLQLLSILSGAFLLCVSYPLAFLFQDIQTIMYRSFFDFLLLICLMSALLKIIKTKKEFDAGDLMRAVVACIVVLGGLLGTIFLFHFASICLVSFPVFYALIFSFNCIETKKPVQISISNKPSRPLLPINHLMLSFITGILVPFASAHYNLISMHLEPLILYLILPILFSLTWLCLIIVSEVWRKKKTSKSYHNDALTLNLLIPTIINKKKILNLTKGVCQWGLLIIVVQLITLTLFNMRISTPNWVWAIVSGAFFIAYVGWIFFDLVKRSSKEIASKHRDFKKMRKIYSLWFISLLFLVLGFILNSIKGLLILQATFLDFQNGQFVTRTDYSTIPPFLPEGVQLTVITLVFLLSAFICLLERLYERKNSIQKVSTPKLAKV